MFRGFAGPMTLLDSKSSLSRLTALHSRSSSCSNSTRRSAQGARVEVGIGTCRLVRSVGASAW
eukprot:4949227-Amphidinium_carterae.2